MNKGPMDTGRKLVVSVTVWPNYQCIWGIFSCLGVRMSRGGIWRKTNKQTNPKRKPKVRALSLVFVPLLKERSRAEDYMGKATCTYI